MQQVYGLIHSHDGMNASQRAIKRFADVVCAILGMIILSPLFIIIAISLKIWGKGSVIFSQERIGYKARPFTIYKFRTMNDDGQDEETQLITERDIKNMTNMRRFIRLHHFDELPQLWNVLKGEMSIVGPRPERKYFIDKIMNEDPDYILIYEMKPGLTSEATLYNGYTDTMEKMLRRLDMDLYYLEHRSWWFDARILGKTFIKIIFGRVF